MLLSIDKYIFLTVIEVAGKFTRDEQVDKSLRQDNFIAQPSRQLLVYKRGKLKIWKISLGEVEKTELGRITSVVVSLLGEGVLSSFRI